MDEIIICVGSSCHLKGSEEIIKIFKEKIKKYDLNSEIKLSGSFCQGNCTDGVNIEINGEKVAGVNEENASEIFSEYLLTDKDE